MTTVTLNLISPHGVPVTLNVQPDDETDAITAMLDRAEAIGLYYADRNWHFADTLASGPSASELDQQPTFCGYPCSHTVDERGLPTWILAGNVRAQRREKQGDVWYSVQDGENYRQILRIPKGEQPPPVRGL